MRRIMIGLTSLLILALAVGTWATGRYDDLVAADQDVKTGWAQVESQLQRRYDLVPNLVRTIQGYATQEREAIDSVNDARARVGQARSIEEKIEANSVFGTSIGQLLLVGEQYPDLMANPNFERLKDELVRTEERIAAETDRYNELVRAYNLRADSFPTSLFAGWLGFEPARPIVAEPFPAARPAGAPPLAADS